MARCPECESSHLTRIATEVESRYDGAREWAVQTGGRYVCNGCGLTFLSRASGVFRLKPKPEPDAQAANAKPKPPPGSQDAIGLRLPSSRA